MKNLGSLMLLTLPLVSSCKQAPAINILGAYFPDWLFCILGGVVVTLIIRALLDSRHMAKWLAPKVLVYPVLTTLFTLLIWLIFFNLYL